MGSRESPANTELVGITSKNIEELKKDVETLDPGIEKLNTLIRSEKSNKNRKQAKKFLEDKLFSKKVRSNLEVAKKDSEDIERIIKNIENLEDLDYFRKKKIEIDPNTLISLVSGTVKEMKKFVRENELTKTQLENILQAEEKIKDRKTAKEFLQKNIREQKLGKDVEEAKEDLENLEDDLNEIESDENSTNIEDRKRELVNDLGLKVSEEVIDNVSVEEFEEFLEEKRKREELIENIIEETESDSKELMKASTSDLEKIAQEIT